MKSTRIFLIAIMALSLSFPNKACAEKFSATIQSSDGVKMILISEGKFTMGSKEKELQKNAPAHRVYVRDFYIDEHPVTNGQFARFLNDIKPTEGPDGTRYSWVVLRSDLEEEERKNWWPTEIAFEYGKYVAYRGYKEHPVITVSWTGAEAYCKWAGKRLPTEAEWEKSARGKLRGKIYPWGDELPTSEVMHSRIWTSNETAAPLGPAKSGAPNGYGLYNMAGGVWEWCFDWYDPHYYNSGNNKDPRGTESGHHKVIRGGSWFNPPSTLRVGLRSFLLYKALDETTGFRCASDPRDKTETPHKESK